MDKQTETKRRQNQIETEAKTTKWNRATLPQSQRHLATTVHSAQRLQNHTKATLPTATEAQPQRPDIDYILNKQQTVLTVKLDSERAKQIVKRYDYNQWK